MGFKVYFFWVLLCIFFAIFAALPHEFGHFLGGRLAGIEVKLVLNSSWPYLGYQAWGFHPLIPIGGGIVPFIFLIFVFLALRRRLPYPYKYSPLLIGLFYLLGSLEEPLPIATN